MPRYCYYCKDCEEEFITFHGLNDIFNICILCEKEDTINRLLSTPVIAKNNTEKTKKQTPGKLTNDYIEMNKQILEEEKLKAKESTYEPS